MTVKLALPTGDSREAVGEMLSRAGVATNGYEPGSRLLRSVLDDGHTLRVFREKDIPIQVALGNYDLGICGDLWLSELEVRFPLQRIVRIGSLPGPRTEVWVAAAEGAGLKEGELPAGVTLAGARVASELPNLADMFAVQLRIPGYSLLPLYGSGDAYPPEDAELVLLPGSSGADVRSKGLVPLQRLYEGGLALIANGDALATRNLGPLIEKLAGVLSPGAPELLAPMPTSGSTLRQRRRSTDVVRLALPDGHAQRHTFAALNDAGLRFDGYEEKSYVRRPTAKVDGLEVKVLRPQDMPQLVAMGAFDVAVTGVDWLQEHLCRFPSSPVEMAVDLGRSRYKIGPVVDDAFPYETTAEALPRWRSLGRPVRIASEYPALADAFARDHQLAHTAIIPISGASEGFVPEDADILIEGSETGASIRANGLKMLDPFMESTNCVIIRREPVTPRTDLIEGLLAKLRMAAASVPVS
jgi:ATP phosphoribosyltransferase